MVNFEHLFNTHAREHGYNPNDQRVRERLSEYLFRAVAQEMPCREMAADLITSVYSGPRDQHSEEVCVVCHYELPECRQRKQLNTCSAPCTVVMNDVITGRRYTLNQFMQHAQNLHRMWCGLHPHTDDDDQQQILFRYCQLLGALVVHEQRSAAS